MKFQFCVSSEVSINWLTALLAPGLKIPGFPQGISNETNAGSDSNSPSLILYKIKSSVGVFVVDAWYSNVKLSPSTLNIVPP